MPIETETVVTRPIERETIVTSDRGGVASVGTGMLIGIGVVIILLLIGGITVFNGGFSFGGKSVTLDVPKVTVSK